MKWRFWTHSASGDFQKSGDELTCQNVDPLLSLYTDGMTSPQETIAIEAHLANCESCRSSLRCLKAMHLVLSNRPAAIPPSDLRLRISAAIAAEASAEAAAPARRLQFRTAYGFALAASAAIIVLLVNSQLGTKTPVVHNPLSVPPLVAVQPKSTPKPILITPKLHKPSLMASLPKTEATPKLVLPVPTVRPHHNLTVEPNVKIAKTVKTNDVTAPVPHVIVPVKSRVPDVQHIAVKPRHDVTHPIASPSVIHHETPMVAKLPTPEPTTAPSVITPTPEPTHETVTAPVQHTPDVHVASANSGTLDTLQVIRNHARALRNASFVSGSIAVKESGSLGLVDDDHKSLPMVRESFGNQTPPPSMDRQ